MSVTIQRIRSLISDKPQHVSEPIAFDGVSLIYRLKYNPIDVTTAVTFTPSGGLPAFTFDQDQGTVTFVSAPPAGNAVADYASVFLSDNSITDMVNVENSFTPDNTADIRLMAADCLDSIASNQALILKRITLQDLQTDGAAVANALRAHAINLREMVYDPKYQEPSFAVIEMVNDRPGFREKVLKDFMRQAI